MNTINPIQQLIDQGGNFEYTDKPYRIIYDQKTNSHRIWLTVNENEIDDFFEDTNGTHLHGYLYVSFQELVKKIGLPTINNIVNNNGNEKVDAEWIIHTPKGVVTIYNYKNGVRYAGDNGVLVVGNKEWHIGAKDSGALNYLELFFTGNNITRV